MRSARALPGGTVPDTVLAEAPHRIGRVALRVRDLDRVADFYRSALGLETLRVGPGRVRLGTDDAVLVELERDATARVRGRGEAGLYHTAFLLPDRALLGAWLAHASRQGIRLTGAADHRVSEAVYLNDPEGNGIEIYADRPSALWPHRGGMIAMASDPLDLDGLVRAGSDRLWSDFPREGGIGHVHLRVGDLAEADAFYGGLLGLGITSRLPGASFYGSGGYHHQLAGNVWSSRGAPATLDRATGLAEVELLMEPEMLAAVRERAAGDAEPSGPDGVSLRDPWGIAITLRPA